MVAVTGEVDFLTLDVFHGVLGNKCFPLDPVLKENLGFLPLAGVLEDCFMSFEFWGELRVFGLLW